MHLSRFTLSAYGACVDVDIDLGLGVTVVLGGNESGKSTTLDALTDLLWGIPPHSPRAHLAGGRKALRIDAVVSDAAGELTLVRRSTGLVEADLVTPARAPWDPEGTGSADWWRTRLGLSLAQLRAGGDEVFAGGGDLAELVFAAREGRSARLLLQALRERRDSLFKGDRRARGVRVREALTAYESARAQRDAMVTRSADVVHSRGRVDRLAGGLREAKETQAQAARLLRMAQEDARAIELVLGLEAAGKEVARIASEGPSVTSDELGRLKEVTREAEHAKRELGRIQRRIDAVESELAKTVVDDDLLLDASTVQRLRLDLGERVSALARADGEFAPRLRVIESELTSAFAELGVAVDPDLDRTWSSVRLAAVVVADVDAACDARTDAQARLDQARHARDATVATLRGRGITVNPDVEDAPRRDLLERLRDRLLTTRVEAVSQRTLLHQAQERRDAAARSAGMEAAPATVNPSDVQEARRRRDESWTGLRTALDGGDMPEVSERAAMVSAVSSTIGAADLMSDREAVERARVSADQARLAEREEQVAAAAADVESARQAHESAEAALVEADNAWDAAWTALHVDGAPEAETSSELITLVSSVFEQHHAMLAAQDLVDQAQREWLATVVRAGLPKDTSPAGWVQRSDLLSRMHELFAERHTASTSETQLRGAWSTFAQEVASLLIRHSEMESVVGSGEVLSTSTIERGLQALDDRRQRASDASRDRSNHQAALQSLRDEQSDHAAIVDDERRLRREIADAHGVDADADLDALVDRATRAEGPRTQYEDALAALRSALDPGSSVAEVTARLAGSDVEGVQARVEEAKQAQEEAEAAVLVLVNEQGAALQALHSLESAGSAAEAEAAVAEAMADLVALTDEWSVLSVQVHLLEETLERIGVDDTRPLLDRAGRILERVTGGRFAALRAEETASSRTLEVVRADGVRMSTHELSEGTADQVFFALRMAAVADLHEERTAAGLPPLPVVLDDVLMAFDDARTADALAVLRDLAEGLQIVVLTHHASVAAAAASLEGVAVSTLPAAASIDGALDGDLIRATAQVEDGGSVESPVVAGARRRDAQQERAAARAWAKEQGLQVSDRGRLPEDLLERYRASRRG